MAENKKLIQSILIAIGLIAIYAYLDQTPSFLSARESVFVLQWNLGLATVALMYWLFKKDKSEALAIFTTGFILLQAGLLDFIYFSIFKLQGKMVDFCVNNNLNQWWAMNIADTHILGNTCTTHYGLLLNVLLGGALSYFIYTWLIKQ